MAILYCDAKRFRQIILAGADWVAQNADHLNKINVFPVPDGDTGSNMSRTLAAAVREMEAVKEVVLETTVKAAAWGALMGARGNSGIILAQVLSGVAEGINGRERLFAEDIARCFSHATRKAYKAILHPAEGTILTVIRETAESAEEAVKTEKDLTFLLDVMTRTALTSVERTPLLLPKLKEAGVVDAGGLGFFYFIEGMLRLMQGVRDSGRGLDDVLFNGQAAEQTEHQWNFRYCTEFVLKGSRIDEDAIRHALGEMGDSIVVVGDTRLARVHIHARQPEEVLRYAARFGQVSSIKVEDMLVQHTSRLESSNGHKVTSLIAVTLGDGLKELFYNAGAELVVDGGPTSNPSISDILAAIEAVDASQVIVLPNDKNVYPGAVQAAAKTSKKVTVLGTSSAPEGLAALLAYMADASFEENVGRIEEAFRDVKSGEVVLAARDVRMDGIEVQSGDFIGIYKGKIRCAGASPDNAVASLLESMLDEGDEIITLYYGERVQKERADELLVSAQSRFADKEVELHYGGQPHAEYIISVE